MKGPRSLTQYDASSYHCSSRELLAILKQHHAASYDHSVRVGLLAGQLASLLGCDRDTIARSKTVGEVHDIGKLAIPTVLLRAPHALTQRELSIMHRHVEQTRRILTGHPVLAPLAQEAALHHEHLDGSGYPSGVGRSQISLAVRIVAVADVFDALTHPRPFGVVHTGWGALDILREGAGHRWEPAVVEALSKYVVGTTQRRIGTATSSVSNIQNLSSLTEVLEAT